MIVKRNLQIITSRFGMRWGRLHAGVDLRTRDSETWRKLPIVAPERIRIKRIVHQRKWGYTIVAEALESKGVLKFTHIKPRDNIVKGAIIEKHVEIADPATTAYMVKKEYGEHLHFERHLKGIPRNPVAYMENLNILYAYKR